MMTDEIHRKFVTIKRKSPQSQLCLSVNIRIKKEIGLFTVVKPLRGKKILGVRLCPHWPAQLKLADISLHGQVCAPKRFIMLVQGNGLWRRRRKRNREEKKGVGSELTFCKEGLILDQVQIGFSNETC